MPPSPTSGSKVQGSLFRSATEGQHPHVCSLREELASFQDFGADTLLGQTTCRDEQIVVPSYTNEFWTSKQRAANRLHEVSYRACFKPQLPRFFIDRLTVPGDIVYDPFMGRGTTLLEAALLGRVPYGNDINPLSQMLVEPRLTPPTLEAVAERLAMIDFEADAAAPDDLLVFYHEETLKQIAALRAYFLDRELRSELDATDKWIRMVAVNRLTGHSPGFFSVYTMPPNQAVTVATQKKINAKREQKPEARDVPDLILRKSMSLLSGVTKANEKALGSVSDRAHYSACLSASTPEIHDESVSLVVTSPPFLDVVQYANDNWLRCWFCGVDVDSVPITMAKTIEDWRLAMTATFVELERVMRPGGYIAFEVGEVRGGTVLLEEAALACGVTAGLLPELVLINAQEFTKTANCWGVGNNKKGTNTNRVVLFRKK